MSGAAASVVAAAPSSHVHARGFHPPLLRPAVDAASDTLLHLVWADLQVHSIEYHTYFSNHLAHGMIALHQLGASAERLEHFWPAASKHLEPLDPTLDPEVGTITRHNYMRHTGNGKGWANWLAFFHEQFARVQQEQAQQRTIGGAGDSSSAEQARLAESALLNEFLPSFLPYMPGHATHPIIHLGLGRVLSDGDAPFWLRSAQASAAAASSSSSSSSELKASSTAPGRTLVPIGPMNPLSVSGLAYLGYHGVRLDKEVEGDGGAYSSAHLSRIPDANSLSLVELLPRALQAFHPLLPQVQAAVKQAPYKDMAIGDFQRRVLFVHDHASDALTAQDALWHIDATNVGEAAVELQHLALLLYGLSDDDFFILHDCTSSFAVRHLLPHLSRPEDRVLALRYALKTVLGVWAVQGLPAKESPHLAAAVQAKDLTAGVKAALKAQENEPKQGWASIRAAAVASDDEHTQKLVWVCVNEAERLAAVSGAAVAEDKDSAEYAWIEWCRYCASKRLASTESGHAY